MSVCLSVHLPVSAAESQSMSVSVCLRMFRCMYSYLLFCCYFFFFFFSFYSRRFLDFTFNYYYFSLFSFFKQLLQINFSDFFLFFFYFNLRLKFVLFSPFLKRLNLFFYFQSKFRFTFFHSDSKDFLFNLIIYILITIYFFSVCA